MIRLTHRRCRHEAEGLADAARHQVQRADELADDLRAAEHALDEVVNACESAEYAQTEADIPEVLRERLVEADRLPIVEADLAQARARIDRLTAERDRVDQARTRMLEAAHEEGRLARTYALMEGAEIGTHDALAAFLLRIRITGWSGFPLWGCQDTDCPSDTRELVWHPDAPEQAHMSCECGRVWPAGPGAADRADRETKMHQAMGRSHRTSNRWSCMSGPSLEAIDRALPTPAQLRDREPVALPA